MSVRPVDVLISAALLLLAGCQTAPVQTTPAQATPVQATPIGNEAATSPINWNGHNRIELPLTPDRGRRPTIPARVMGQNTIALIDSGAGIPAISRVLAADAGASNVTAEVNGQQAETVKDVPLELGSMSTLLPMAIVIDHNAERPFVVGADIFLHAIVEMDFEAGRLALIHPETFTPPAGEPVTVKLWNSLPTAQLKVNGHEREVCAVIDTGFNGGLAVTTQVAAELALPPSPAGGTRVAQDGFGNRYERPVLAPLQEMRIGELAYGNVPVTHGLPQHEAEQCGNVLGMAVLYRHRLIFDLMNQRVWLIPR